jgi:hypothetical protein
MRLWLGWQVPLEYAMAAQHYRHAGDPEEYPGQQAAKRASLKPNPPVSVDYAWSW